MSPDASYAGHSPAECFLAEEPGILAHFLMSAAERAVALANRLVQNPSSRLVCHADEAQE